MRLRFLTRSIIHLLDFYHWYVSRSFPSSCRFYPTCSEYSKQAILKYGLVLGIIIAFNRLIRCHPFSGSQGFDPLR